MKSEERVTKTLNFEKTDTIPVYDIINNKSIYEYLSGERITNETDMITLSAGVYKELGIDCTRGFYNPKWQYTLIEGWIDFLGAPREGWELDYNEDTSWIIKTPFSSLKDLEKYFPTVPDEKVIEQVFVESFTEKRDVFAPEVQYIASIAGFMDQAYRFIGYELFSLGTFDAPELINQLIEVFFQTQMIYLKLYGKYKMSHSLVYCDDLAFNTSTLFSPAFLEDVYFHRLKRLVDEVHTEGIKFIFHSDGNLYPIIESLYSCGIDGLNPLEILAGMDIVEVRKRYPKLVLIGGIDCSQLLPYGTYSEIKKEISRIVNEIGALGGIMLGSTTEIHSAISLDNLRCMIDNIKESGSKI